MKNITCSLVCESNSEHLQQIYTGFAMLARSNRIQLSQECSANSSNKQQLLVVINNIRVFYDTADGYGIDTTMLGEVDWYFKRSYLPGHVNDLGPQSNKIKPLGLNYLVYPDFSDSLGFSRGVAFRKLGYALDSLQFRNRLRPMLTRMEDTPQIKSSSKVLFMVGAYDPHDVKTRPENEVEERIAINKTRAECIKELRKEFGKQFYGGFIHTPFSKAHFKDLLVQENNNASKMNYISLLKEFPICVATTGLHGSIGWKFGEYVAFSKAIVTEKLNYQVPGNFQSGVNYLEFSSAHDCVESVARLFKDSELRNKIMHENLNYYLDYVRPDVLVMKTLRIAMSGK